MIENVPAPPPEIQIPSSWAVERGGVKFTVPPVLSTPVALNSFWETHQLPLSMGWNAGLSTRTDKERSAFRVMVIISAQLIDARDDRQIWADSFEGELSDILRAQRQLGEAVTRAVRVELGPGIDAHREARSVDPEAYAAYLEGRYFWSRRTADSLEKAICAFHRAVMREPTYAPAQASLGRCHMAFMQGLLPRSEAQPIAEAAVRRALELDDQLAEAHATLGALETVAGDYPAA